MENLYVQERSWLPVSGQRESLRAVEEVTTWRDQERTSWSTDGGGCAELGLEETPGPLLMTDVLPCEALQSLESGWCG